MHREQIETSLIHPEDLSDYVPFCWPYDGRIAPALSEDFPGIQTCLLQKVHLRRKLIVLLQLVLPIEILPVRFQLYILLLVQGN